MAEATHSDELRKTTDLEVWRLLPWLVNDTLEGEELDRVLDHLKESSECRRELLFLSELHHATQLASDERLQPSQERFGRLMARIDRFEATRSASSKTSQVVPAASAANHGRAPRGRLLVARAAVLAVLLGALVWALVSGRSAPGMSQGNAEDPRGFRTLSEQSTPAEAEWIQGPRLRLIFEDGVEERQLRTLLLDAGAEIVGGPTALGVYTVELSAGGEAAAEDLAEALRQDPRIAFVEIVFHQRVTGRERAP